VCGGSENSKHKAGGNLMDTNILVDLLLVAVIIAFIMAVFSYMGWVFNRIHHHGRRIIATITEIRYGIGPSPTKFSRDHPYVTAQWTDPRTGQIYTFWQLASENKPYFNIGMLVPVLIDPNHPKFYQMEI
jgi:hypothetical protein